MMCTTDKLLSQIANVKLIEDPDRKRTRFGLDGPASTFPFSGNVPMVPQEENKEDLNISETSWRQETLAGQTHCLRCRPHVAFP